ncbi:hypothetical protein B0B24_01490 [Pseudomonas aeruginosa]|nr:hypothetical protein B0B24_01490 [Pseudomonas aeruginosa]ONM83239.1 hypothetical protein B0B25_01490 [Pseudomonas aeruginosa]OOH16717.1 hypothetical protein B0B33_00790 [Pseudomonas aeruginosa]RQG61780.1 hypothetical protein IPC197_08740 [Pseudomonas aeruginosa]
MSAIIRVVIDSLGADAAKNMKPYFVRFIEDLRDGVVTLDGDGRAQAAQDNQSTHHGGITDAY